MEKMSYLFRSDNFEKRANIHYLHSAAKPIKNTHMFQIYTNKTKDRYYNTIFDRYSCLMHYQGKKDKEENVSLQIYRETDRKKERQSNRKIVRQN